MNEEQIRRRLVEIDARIDWLVGSIRFGLSIAEAIIQEQAVNAELLALEAERNEIDPPKTILVDDRRIGRL